VVLGQRPAEQSYINASWIKEPVSSPRHWIASQAPTDETVHDFLSLFLQAPKDAASTILPKSPPKVILMLTACRESGRQKSARYWPDSIGQSIDFEQYIPSLVEQPVSNYQRPEMRWQQGPLSPIAVTFVSSKSSSEQDEKQHRGWRTNELLLASNKAEVTIYQVEYLGWQDHGVPDSPHEVLQLLEHIDSLLKFTGHDGAPGTLVTHCSAGVGRTGSFIAIAWLARLLEEMKQSSYSSISALEKCAQMSPLGPLPPPSYATSSTRATHRSGGLLPSFLHKDDKQQFNTTNTSHGETSKFDFVMATIDNLRDQRTTMVQTPKQVEFVYEVAKVWWEENAR
jgi:protein-tyrosine phosphatase